MKKITHWVLGTATARVSGDTARFMNIAVKTGLRPIRLQKDGKDVLFTLYAKDYKKLHKIKQRTHTRVKLAEKSGVVDYLGVGPVYATQTKVDVGEAVGLKYVTYAHEHTKLPFVAIGGIKEHNIHDVAKAGAKTIAVVSDIVGAVDIENKVQKLYQCMDIQV